MKTRMLMIAALAVTTISFAQKKEVKALDKAVKSGQYTEAKTLVTAAEGLVSSMDSKTKQKFLLLKAKAFLGSDNKNIEELKMAAETFTMLKGTSLSSEADNGIYSVVGSIINSAVEDQDNNRFESAAGKLSDAYTYSNNKDYLFFAASNYLNAKNYPKASMFLQQLHDEGYTGQKDVFYAVSAKTGERKEFPSKGERDARVLSKEYINPTQELTESREETIINYLISIYSNEGENHKALTLIDKAIAKDPNNSKLLLSKSQIYLKDGKTDKYKEVVEKLLAQDANNAELTFNVGVSEDQLGNKEKAREYYDKAIKIDPTYTKAYTNMAALILSSEKSIVDEMNSLGTSNADYNRYDTLKAKRTSLYQDAKPYLEKALETDSSNIAVAKTLYSVLQQLGDTSGADAVKSKIDALGGN